MDSALCAFFASTETFWRNTTVEQSLTIWPSMFRHELEQVGNRAEYQELLVNAWLLDRNIFDAPPIA